MESKQPDQPEPPAGTLPPPPTAPEPQPDRRRHLLKPGAMLVLGIAVAAVLIAVGLWPWGQLVAGVVVVVSAAKAREQYSTPAFYLIVCAGLYFTIMGAISSYTWLTDHGL